MQRGFSKGMFIGSVIGASVGMMMDNRRKMNSRSRKRMLRSGKVLLRKSGNLINDIVDMLR